MIARRSPILGTTTPVRSAHDEHRHDADEGQRHARSRPAPAELVLRVEHPHRGQRVVRHLVEEHREQQARHHGQMGEAPEQRRMDWRASIRTCGAARAAATRAARRSRRSRSPGPARPAMKNGARGSSARDQAADHRAEREAGAPGGADEAEILGAIFVVADVADVCARGRERGAEHARHGAADEQPRHRRWPCRSAGNPRRTRPATTTTPAGARCGR